MFHKNLFQKISGHGTETINLPESKILIRSPGGNDKILLSVTTNATDVYIEHMTCNTLNGQPINLQSRSEETYCPPSQELH
eukprot:9014748-Ditylum_brightwellii.AAC.1